MQTQMVFFWVWNEEFAAIPAELNKKCVGNEIEHYK